MKNKTVHLDEITVRNDLRPGDLGYIIYLHGIIYHKENSHNIDFEAYVAEGMADLWHQYDSRKDRGWICEHESKIIGSLFLQHKKERAQLRYFLIHPQYRGIGLGKKLMALYMDFMRECGYSSCFLLTTKELGAAASLYKRHGFVLTEEKPNTRFGKRLTEQVYEWTKRQKYRSG